MNSQVGQHQPRIRSAIWARLRISSGSDNVFSAFALPNIAVLFDRPTVLEVQHDHTVLSM